MSRESEFIKQVFLWLCWCCWVGLFVQFLGVFLFVCFTEKDISTDLWNLPSCSLNSRDKCTLKMPTEVGTDKASNFSCQSTKEISCSVNVLTIKLMFLWGFLFCLSLNTYQTICIVQPLLVHSSWSCLSWCILLSKSVLAT